MSGRDVDFDALSEKEIFEEARDRLQIALDAEFENRTRAKTAILFREGIGHWDSDYVTSASQETPELTINLTDALVRRVVNNIKQQRPRGKAHPMGDGADVESAEVINGIGRHVEYRSEASVAYDTAADCSVTGGWGYARLVAEFVAPDSFDKDLRILPIRNVFTVYFDPGAVMPAGQDAMWCLVSTRMKRIEYKRQYPQMDNTEWNDSGRDEASEEWEDKEEVRLAEYFRITEKSETLYRIERMDGTEYTCFESQLAPQIDLSAKGERIAEKRDSLRRRVEWFRLNGTRVVDREILPGSFIPIFRCEGNVADVDGKVMRRGMVESMMDPQRMVDYGETAKIKRLGISTQAKYIAAAGQVVGHPEWEDSNTVPHMVLTYEPVTITTAQGEVPLPPPQAIPPAQVEAGFTEFVQGMRTNLMAVAGMPSEPGADTQGTVVSGKAIQKRQGYSDQSHFQYYDNLTLMIAQLWRVMLEWIPHYFSEERMQRIIGEDGTPEMVKINERVNDDPGGVARVKNDLSVGRYDVVMDTGPGYETKREEGAENLINLLQVQALAEIIAKTGPDLVFRSIDHPYMQELADRLMAQNPEGLKKVLQGLSSRARSLVQSLGNQVQQLQQALQAAQQEIKQQTTRAHLEATVKAHDVEESNKTKRLDTETRADTALKVEAMRAHVQLADTEIKTGGEILHTHVKAAHEAKAAERMIQTGENGAAK
jgi:hypothetical protein